MQPYSQPQPYNPPAVPNTPPHRHVARRRRQPSISWWMIGAGIAVAGVVFLVSVIALLALLIYPSGSRIPAGVAVAGVSLGGKSPEQATQLLTDSNLTARPVLLIDGTRQWTLTLADLGVSVDIPLTVQRAADAAPDTDVQPWYTIDLNTTQDALVALSSQVNIAAVPGNPPQMGRAMDIPAMLDRLYQDLPGELGDGVFELTMIEVAPPEVDDSSTSYTGETTVHVVEQGQELGLIAKMYDVNMQDIVQLNDLSNPDLLYVGQELTIPAAGMYEPTQADAPAAPTTVGKSIVVSTQKQRIYAYENGQLVHSYLVSTGLPDSPTVLGDFKIYVKYTATDMKGPGYYLPSVPYTMYFYQGYGIHGTYWHNSFGRPMSHGCVNLPTPEAKWFFDWADVGTPVRVI
jgi:lipoprotein-anchoring transpeptidase ErfK/SrfK